MCGAALLTGSVEPKHVDVQGFFLFALYRNTDFLCGSPRSHRDFTGVGRSLRQAPEYTPGNYEYDQMGMSGKQFQRLNIQFHKFIILLRYWGQKIKK